MTGPDTTHNGSTDSFVVRIEGDGSGFAWAGYIGGSAGDVSSAHSIAVGPDGDAYVSGTTSSTEVSFPDGDGFGTLTGPDTTYNGSQDAFVVRLEGDGSGFAWAGYVGGSGSEGLSSIAVGPDGDAYVTGNTASG